MKLCMEEIMPFLSWSCAILVRLWIGQNKRMILSEIPKLSSTLNLNINLVQWNKLRE